jgi:UDP-GlcNAc:undecaprenyl-phosphate/decaprenyl-phosphate GlcNAc-1-phosphate transferase
MAAATMAVGGRTQDPFSGQTFFFYAPLVIPLLILGVPIFDTAFAILRRASKRQGLATADKDHLHHRLMRLGHGQRRSVAILWGWTALLSGLVLFPTYSGKGDAIVPIGVAGLCLVLYTVLHPTVRRERRLRQDGRSAAQPGVSPGTPAGGTTADPEPVTGAPAGSATGDPTAVAGDPAAGATGGRGRDPDPVEGAPSVGAVGDLRRSRR